MTPQEFVSKWKDSQLSERSSAQSHFIDLCRLVGQPTPADIDTTGSEYTFEAGAAKTDGKHGWADVWKRGCFGWEYKGPHKDLVAAYDQLLRYKDSLENPPLLIVSDIVTIEVNTNYTNTVKVTEVFTLEDLLDSNRLALLAKAWTEPEAFKADAPTRAKVTEEAAKEFATLAETLRKWGHEPDAAAHFLIRLLFCLFAEDVGILPDAAFSDLIKSTRTRPDLFASGLRELFRSMVNGGMFGSKLIPWVNGGLFDDDTVIELDLESLKVLEKVAKLDWSAVEPAILGTLFVRSLDPAQRSQLGAQYTSREDILLIVEPVVMEPLRRRWVEVKEAADARLEEVQKFSLNRDRRKGQEGVRDKHLVPFMRELAGVEILDPACGSGNFLYVALNQLLDLWKEVFVYMGERGMTLPMALEDTTPSPHQLHGIEINAYAHELAQTTVWIGYLQWLKENGFGTPSEPILKPLDSVCHQDAILMMATDGTPVDPEWPEADVIIGNPPFLGDRKMKRELGAEYVSRLRDLYADQLPASSDLVCYWFERARAAIASGAAVRAGLIATNSIRTGSNRTVLDRILASGGIFLAWSDRAWILEGAAVRVSIVGFDDGSVETRFLDGHEVARIHADLTSSIDVTAAKTLDENAGLAFIGVQRTGPFELQAPVAEELLASHGNPNSRPNSDVIRPWITAVDIVQRPRHRWIVDFGTDMTHDQAAQYEAPFEYLREHVRPYRQGRYPRALEEIWWRHWRPRPEMRAALDGLERFIATPLVSKHRIFAWFSTDVLPENLVVAVAREDDYFFGVLHSRLHEAWALSLASWLGAGNDPRYSPRLLETYPFPWPPGSEPFADSRVEAIANAARRLVEKRRRWLNPESASDEELKKRTLTNLYNEYPTWLRLAHEKLDRAVLDAYGWPPDLTNEEILERLLRLNQTRAVATKGSA